MSCSEKSPDFAKYMGTALAQNVVFVFNKGIETALHDFLCVEFMCWELCAMPMTYVITI